MRRNIGMCADHTARRTISAPVDYFTPAQYPAKFPRCSAHSKLLCIQGAALLDMIFDMRYGVFVVIRMDQAFRQIAWTVHSVGQRSAMEPAVLRTLAALFCSREEAGPEAQPHPHPKIRSYRS